MNIKKCKCCGLDFEPMIEEEKTCHECNFKIREAKKLFAEEE